MTSLKDHFIKLLTAALSMTLLLSACSEGAPNPSSSPEPTSNVAEPTPDPMNEEKREEYPNMLDTRFDRLPLIYEKPDYEYIVSPWKYLQSYDDAISIRYYNGNGMDFMCGKAFDFWVTETDESIVISPLSKKATANHGCFVPLSIREGTIYLKKPIGDRKIYHGKIPEDLEKYNSDL